MQIKKYIGIPYDLKIFSNLKNGWFVEVVDPANPTFYFSLVLKVSVGLRLIYQNSIKETVCKVQASS
jgi:hypothetical protein